MNEVSGDDNWSLDTLLDILKTEVEAREKCHENSILMESLKRSRIVTRPYLPLPPHYLLRARTETKLVPFVVDNTLQHSDTLLLISEKEGIFSGDKVVAFFVSGKLVIWPRIVTFL